MSNKLSLLLLGQSQVGKTTLLFRMSNAELPTSINATIGVDFTRSTVYVNNEAYSVILWDTAGQEKYSKISKNFLRKADGAIFVFDVTSRDSFDAIDKWIESIEDVSFERKIPYIIIGNKTDRPDRMISREEGQKYAQGKKSEYFECSGLMNSGDISKSLNRIVDLVIPTLNQFVEPLEPITKKDKCC